MVDQRNYPVLKVPGVHRGRWEGRVMPNEKGAAGPRTDDFNAGRWQDRAAYGDGGKGVEGGPARAPIHSGRAGVQA